jgi:hypothetical protein
MPEPGGHLHRRLLPLVASIAAIGSITACASTPDVSPPAGVPEDAGGPGADAGVICFACGGTTPEELDASLAFRVRARFAACDGQEGCHVSGAGGLTFPPGNELAFVVGVPSTERPDLARVKPGDPSASYVYLKVSSDAAVEGGRMPLGAETFDPRIPETIFAWIEAGAPPE